MIRQLADAYFRRDLPMLRNWCDHQPLVQALDLHWRGDLQSAQRLYARLDLSEVSQPIRELGTADALLVDVKLGGLLKAPTMPAFATTLAQIISYYAIYSWAFWADHKRAWQALRMLTVLALKLKYPGALQMCVFLAGHMSAIHGWHGFGLRLARMAHRRVVKTLIRNSRAPSFFNNIVIAAYPYTCLVSSVRYKIIQEGIIDGERIAQIDPYYRCIFNVSALYAAAYNGDIARAEVYSQSLRECASGNLRYAMLADIIAFIPYVLRGYAHLVKSKLDVISPVAIPKMEPLVAAQASRLLAFMALHDQRWTDALNHIESARKATSKLGNMVFWRHVDQRIEEIAQRAMPFKIADLSPLVTGSGTDRSLDTLGTLLTELLLVFGKAGDNPEAWYISNVAQALSSHLGSQEYSLLPLSQRVEGTAPCIKFLDTWIVFHGLASARHTQARNILAALSPMVATLERCREEQATVQKMAEEAALGGLARQVSHDIRSPLAALDLLSKSACELNEDHRVLLSMACERIGYIAGQLTTRALKKHSGSEDAAVCLEALVMQIVKEKSFEFSQRENLKIGVEMVEGEQNFVAVNAGELCRALSNLINNAAEAATDGNHSITVSVNRDGDQCLLQVRDDGTGIPEDVLKLLCRRGATFHKPGGTGLGLYHAKSLAERAGGGIEISSVLGSGTCVKLSFPAEPSPKWHCDEIRVPRSKVVAILDDDRSVHLQWKSRLLGVVGPHVELHGFETVLDITTWLDSNAKKSSALFLLDYDLGPDAAGAGLALAQERGLLDRVVVVTNKFMDACLHETCVALGVPLLPKPLIENVAIAVTAQPA